MSAPFVPTAPNAVVARQSSVGRLLNLIVDPASTFRGIAQHSPWALAFLVAVVLRFGSLFLFYRPAVTPLKLVGGVVFQVTTVAPQLLLASVLIWLVAKPWNLSVGWKVAFSIATHVYVAYTIATVAIASVAGALLPESSDVDLRSPPFTNVAWFVADSVGGTLRRVLQEVDVRGAYALVLLWLGLRAAAPSETRPVAAWVVATAAFVRVAGVVVVQALR